MTIKTVILGATGYVSAELLRLLASHPEFEFGAAVSTSQQGNSIGSVFPHLQAAYPQQAFCSMDEWASTLDSSDRLAIFSAAPHGASAIFVKDALDNASDFDVHVVDSSADFRYPGAAEFKAVYGSEHAAPDLLADFTCAVPEHATTINSPHVGHPGCFATAMLLSAVPLYQQQLLTGDLFISGITGSTGSGRSPQAGTHHPERHSNLYAYKPLDHRHVPEVLNLIMSATGQAARVRFIPHSGPFARGIYVTLQATLAATARHEDVSQVFEDHYAASEFVQIVDGMPKLKSVVASNYAHIGVKQSGDHVAVTCAIDNLVKGAAGGAIQWMNRLWSLPESSGLTAPPPAWT